MTVNRSVCTIGPEKCSPRTLAETIHCVARHSDLPAREVAARIGVTYAWFVKVTEDSLPRAKAPSWLMHALAVHTGRTEHLERQARDAGLVVYRIPDADVAHGALMAATVKEFGELLQAFATRSANGIDDAEFVEVEREGQEAISAIAKWLDSMRPSVILGPKAVRA
jgi:hypothetical protein